MLRTALVILSLIGFCDTSFAQPQKTLKHAYKSYLLLSYLKVASVKCNFNQYYSTEVKNNYASFVLEKLLIPIEKFEKIVSKESDFTSELSSFSELFLCSSDKLDLDFDIQMLLDNYEAALFLFEMAPTLEGPLLSKNEYIKARDKAIRETISELIKDANSIVIGTLHDIDMLPENYRNPSIQIIGYQYAFETSYGWKQPPPHKFIPIKSLELNSALNVKWPKLKTDEQLIAEEKAKESKSLDTYKGDEVMIIRSQQAWKLLYWEPVNGSNMVYFFEQLGERDWEYEKSKFKYLD
jgi:hypothetical protein